MSFILSSKGIAKTKILTLVWRACHLIVLSLWAFCIKASNLWFGSSEIALRGNSVHCLSLHPFDVGPLPLLSMVPSFFSFCRWTAISCRFSLRRLSHVPFFRVWLLRPKLSRWWFFSFLILFLHLGVLARWIGACVFTLLFIRRWWDAWRSLTLSRFYFAYLETQKLVIPADMLALERHCQGSKRLNLTLFAYFFGQIGFYNLDITTGLVLVGVPGGLLHWLSNFGKTALGRHFFPMSLFANIAFIFTFLQISASLEWQFKLKRFILCIVHLKRRH